MTNPLAPGGIADHTTCLLVKLGQVLYRLTEDELGSHGLRVRHYSILQALADNGSMSQLALGTHLRIDPATMVSSLDELEALGAASRARDPRDRRRYVIELTAKGKRTLARANEAMVSVDDRVLADIEPSARTALHSLLATLNSGPTLPTAFDRFRDQPTAKPAS